jgi:hypothetical protein
LVEIYRLPTDSGVNVLKINEMDTLNLGTMSSRAKRGDLSLRLLRHFVPRNDNAKRPMWGEGEGEAE